eukprot:scpid39343/ scgid11813/ Nidogen-1; Entactin
MPSDLLAGRLFRLVATAVVVVALSVTPSPFVDAQCDPPCNQFGSCEESVESPGVFSCACPSYLSGPTCGVYDDCSAQCTCSVGRSPLALSGVAGFNASQDVIITDCSNTDIGMGDTTPGNQTMVYIFRNASVTIFPILPATVTEVDASFNSISNLGETIFPAVLAGLTLSHQTTSLDFFPPFFAARLLYLDLSNTTLVFSPIGISSTLESVNNTLRHLLLSGTGQISADMGNLGVVETLDLSNNMITDDTIGPDVFGQYPSLKTLDLSDNSISFLLGTMFAGNQEIVTLRLGRNPINTMQDNVFSLPKLEELFVNSLTSPAGAGQLALPASLSSIELPVLRVINFDSAQLSALPSVFEQMPALEELYLGNNMISAIPPFLLYNVPQLRILDLKQNSIGSFSTFFFSGNLLLERIDLTFNNLNTLDANVFVLVEQLNTLAASDGVFLAGNPLSPTDSCDNVTVAALVEAGVVKDVTAPTGPFSCTISSIVFYTLTTQPLLFFCPNGDVPSETLAFRNGIPQQPTDLAAGGVVISAITTASGGFFSLSTTSNASINIPHAFTCNSSFGFGTLSVVFISPEQAGVADNGVLSTAGMPCGGAFGGNGAICASTFPPCSEVFLPCSMDATCMDTATTGVVCTCAPGFSGNGVVCDDVDECAGTGACDSNATCANTISSFLCQCNAGYTGDGLTCADIDECLDEPCADDRNCTNTIGSFNCDVCKYGLTVDGAECEVPCPVNCTCTVQLLSPLPLSPFVTHSMTTVELVECIQDDTIRTIPSRTEYYVGTSAGTSPELFPNVTLATRLLAFATNGLNSEQNLQNLAFQNHPNLQAVNLDLSAVGDLFGSFFSFQLSALRYFSIADGFLESLDDGFFQSVMPNIGTLLLRNTFLGPTLPDSTFMGLGNLTELDLSATEVQISGTLLSTAGLTSLSTLTLSNLVSEGGTNISSQTFSNLPALTTIDLSRTRIGTYGPAPFSSAPTLLSLNLEMTSFFAVGTVPGDLVAGLPNLVTLNLNSAVLPVLTDTTFADLHSLETLNLDSNGLTSLPAGLFGNTTNLITLTLMSNSLAELPPCVFFGLTSLKTLDLSRNQITQLGGGIFAYLTSLATLNLQVQPLTSLSITAFASSLDQISNLLVLETDIVVQDVCDAIEHDIIQRLTGTPEPATFGGPVCNDVPIPRPQAGLRVPLDSSIVLTCPYGSLPPASIRWQFSNGTQIVGSDRVTVGDQILQIRNATVADSAEYQCCVDGGPCSQSSVLVEVTSSTAPAQCTECGVGFQTGNTEKCVDIDECTESGGGSGSLCDDSAVGCQNLVGSFTCVCPTGFSSFNATSCQDVNECTTGTHNCSGFATCDNTVGAFTCLCNSGFSGDGFDCEDIDECVNSPCPALRNCTNTVGAFNCDVCTFGFAVDG